MAQHTLHLTNDELLSIRHLIELELCGERRDLRPVEVGLLEKIAIAQCDDQAGPTARELAYNFDTRHPGADSADGPAF